MDKPRRANRLQRVVKLQHNAEHKQAAHHHPVRPSQVCGGVFWSLWAIKLSVSHFENAAELILLQKVEKVLHSVVHVGHTGRLLLSREDGPEP